MLTQIPCPFIFIHTQQPNIDDTASFSETTAELSPVKGEESDSYDDKFDLYFASSYLPHMPVSNKDDLNELEGKPSIHFKAFLEASEMEVPPVPPQKARTRRQYSMVESGNVLRPINLSNSFSKNVNTERQSNTINKTKEHLRSIGNELIEAVEHSHADFNLMLKRMSSEKKSINLKNRLTEPQDPPAIPPVESKTIESPADVVDEATSETTSKKSTVPKTMGEIKEYLSQFRAAASTSFDDQESYRKYHQLFKSKMEAFTKTLSSVAPDAREASSTCEANMCNFMEVAEEILNPTLNQSGYVSSTTPLNQSWFEVDDDSDSVSKLTMPFHHSELSVSALSEFAPGDEVMVPVEDETPVTRATIVSYDF